MTTSLMIPRVSVSVLLLLLLGDVPGQAGQLERVSYNNPGLVVDLGVGLWAWPLPLDYDGDGDLDLLVACPDKPHNGVYFFENPGKNNQETMPVFRPGVWVGRASNNFQVSYVDGKARILKPGYEFVDFRKQGFDKPRKIFPTTSVHPGPVRANQWRYVDYDGDGRQDLVVGVGDWTEYGWDDAHDAQGRWRNGPLHGYVYWMRNTGADGKPRYDPPRRVQAGRQDVDVYGMPSPNFADFDGDGDLDLLCGEFLDGFTYFENIGRRTEPVYAIGRKLGHSGQPLRMELQMITPVAVDWDRDGDVDLIVGDEDGRVALVEHTGQVVGGVPQFLPPKYFQQQAEHLKFGALATPCAIDWDGDGDEDLLCGNTAGHIGFFENLGGAAKPKWAAVRLLEADGRTIRIQAGPNGSIQGPCEAKWGYTTLSVADWDHDGLPDLLVNSIWGRVVWYRNTGSRREPKLAAAQPVEVQWNGPPPKPAWNWWDANGHELVTQWRTTPMAVDFTGDGLTDLVMLDQQGYLCLFRRTRQPDGLRLMPPERIFIDEDNRPIRLNPHSAGSSGRYKIMLTDWDGDGRLDLLVNSTNADWYRNCETRGGKIVLRHIGPLGKRKLAGHTSSPTVVDWNKDGKPDLLVGAEDGYLYYLNHGDAISYDGNAVNARAAVDSNPTGLRARAGVVREEFVFTRVPFPQCHASTIVETNRGLVAAWFGGTREKHSDVGIWVSYHNGGGWSRPLEAVNGVQYDGHRHPCWNPVLFQPRSGPLMLFYKCGPSPSRWWGMLTLSHDRGRSWNDPHRLPEGIDGPVKNKPIQLPGGDILSGSSTEYDGWRVHFERTSDLGRTWRRIGPINDGKTFNAIQPSILTHRDGRLQILCRSKEQRITTSWSQDNGLTWSAMTATNLPNPNAGTDAVTLADGRHLLVYNHTLRGKGSPRGREMLNVALSDDGIEWRAALVLENDKHEFSYPAVIQTADRQVHITYT
jgi:predicted neuraminidase